MFVRLLLFPLWFLSWVLGRLSAPAFLRWGAGLGRCLSAVGFRTKIVEDNLQLALGSEKTPSELAVLKTQIYSHIGTLFLEIARNFNFQKTQFFEHLQISPEDLLRLEGYKKDGRGLIVMSAHIGNWELFPSAMAARGFPVSVIAKKMSSPVAQRIIEDKRCKTGFDIIYAGNTLHKMAEALRAGKFIGFMVDQHMPGKKGLRVDFFKTPAASIRGLAKLARETRCRIVPMCIFRQNDGTHRLLVMDEVPYLECNDLAEGSSERLLREEWVNTQNYQNVIEKMIRYNLAQWLWIHRRWKADRTPLNPATAHLDNEHQN